MGRSKIRSFVLTAALFCLAATRVDAETIAIVGGTLIDGKGGKPIADGVIVIEDKRIVAIGGKGTPIPPRARTIAATGKYVIPGLMDANVHLVLDNYPVTLIRYEGRYDELALEAAQVALKNGVTTVFDSWGPRQYLVKARNAVNEGRVVASRIYLAGNIVGLGGPFSDDFYPQFKDAVLDDFAAHTNRQWQENVGPELLWMSPQEVRHEIREYVRKDIDFVKYAVNGHSLGTMQYIGFSPRVQDVIVEEAHRAGLTVQTHTTSSEGIELAVRAGVDLMQHCDISGPKPIPAEIVALIAQRRIPCAFLAHTAEALKWYGERASQTAFFKYLQVGDVNERALLKAGAVILLSTDAGVFSSNTTNSSAWKAHAPPRESLVTLGEGHFSWLLAVEQKGMKPMDALMAATLNIAKAYNMDKDLGSLEPGKLADLLILDKNPLEAAENYRSIHTILKDGAVVDRDALPIDPILTRPMQSPAEGHITSPGGSTLSRPQGPL